LKTVTIDDVILSSIDKGLECLGESTKGVLYFNFELKTRLNRREIAGNCDEFLLVLRLMLGPGSEILERSILEQLRLQTGRSDLPSDLFTTVNSLKSARQKTSKK
jgi:hypothetical protein